MGIFDFLFGRKNDETPLISSKKELEKVLLNKKSPGKVKVSSSLVPEKLRSSLMFRGAQEDREGNLILDLALLYLLYEALSEGESKAEETGSSELVETAPPTEEKSEEEKPEEPAESFGSETFSSGYSDSGLSDYSDSYRPDYSDFDSGSDFGDSGDWGSGGGSDFGGGW